MYVTSEDSVHAFFYSEGIITDLSLLPSVVAAGWTDLWVEAINNNGQIAGYGRLNDGEPQAFLLSYDDETTGTIPEPGTLLLVGLGLLSLYARRRSSVTRLV